MRRSPPSRRFCRIMQHERCRKNPFHGEVDKRRDGGEKVKEYTKYKKTEEEFLKDENIYKLPEHEVIITDNMFGEFIRYSNEYSLESKNIISGLNGAMIAPNKMCHDFKILINKNIFNPGCFYKHTIYHELTHMLDFYSFMSEEDIFDNDLLKDTKYFWVFFYWTEYHAKFVGYRKHHFDSCMLSRVSKQDELGFLHNKAIPYYTNDLIKNIKTIQNDFSEKREIQNRILVDLYSFFSRINLWKIRGINIYSEKNEYISILKSINKEIMDVFNEISKNNSYENFSKNKSALDSILYTLEGSVYTYING